MTERLYYTDAALVEFTATVLRSEPGESGVRVWLDRTAFYPTSGGQPHDLGSLGEAQVTDVSDADDGSVIHTTDRQLREGEQVIGRVAWARRFDHMQQHTGQHVLSGAFERVLRARTESFHLGAATASIDLNSSLTPDQIAAAEAEANQFVFDDRPVSVRFVEPEEAARLPLRKPSVRMGKLRLIDIEGVDLSACGGTHVSRTGSIGLIAVSGWEKVRAGTRLHFLCGGRALRLVHELRDTTSALSRLLSVEPAEMPLAVERLQADGRRTSRALRDAHERLALHDVQQLLARTSSVEGRRVLVAALPDVDAAQLKALASAAAQAPGVSAALFSASIPALLAIARHPALDVDAAAVLRQLTGRFGGKGGGKPDLAQGGGLTGDTDAMLAAARELLAQ